MSNRDEDKIKRDFNKAMQAIEDAFSSAIFGAFNWGKKIGQMLASIRKHKEELQAGVQTTLTTGKPPQNPALAASAFDQGLKTLANGNPIPTPEQNNQFTKANVTSAMLGTQKLSEPSREKATEVKEALDSTLRRSAHEVKQLRMPQPQEPSAGLSTEPEQRSRFTRS